MNQVTLSNDRLLNIFISGPMSGLPNYNFAAFNEAAAMLADEGYNVYNPADFGIVEGAEWGDYIRATVAMLMQCESIYMLKDWNKSSGAKLELQLAQTLKMRVIFQESEQ